MTQPTIEQIKEALDGATDGSWEVQPVASGAFEVGIGWWVVDPTYDAGGCFEDFQIATVHEGMQDTKHNADLTAMAPYLARMVLDLSEQHAALQAELAFGGDE